MDQRIMSPKKSPMLVDKTLDVPDFIEYPILLGKGFRIQCGHIVDTSDCTGLHRPSILCTVCNALVLYAARAGPALRLACTRADLCTISRGKARRREGDKCFSDSIFFPRGFSILSGQHRSYHALTALWTLV